MSQIKHRLMGTFTINTTLLTLCHSDISHPSEPPGPPHKRGRALDGIRKPALTFAISRLGSRTPSPSIPVEYSGSPHRAIFREHD